MAEEKPISAAAVRNTLISVTICVLSFRVKRSDIRLEHMVPPDIIMDTMPILEMGTPNIWRMAGQAAPNRESGRPRLINAR